MPTNNYIWELAEAYAAGTLPAGELNALQTHLDTDPAFAATFQESIQLIQSLSNAGSHKKFRSMLRSIHEEELTKAITMPGKPRTISLRVHYLRTAAVAAGIAVLTSASTYWGFTINSKKANTQYSVLRHEVESIKKSQNAIIRNINQKNSEPAPPPSQVKYTGTGFAITNDGYFVTNYHVTDGADSIYIQTQKGRYYKAYMVAFEPKTDIAILKVDDNNFHFGKGDIPYTFSTSKSGLGANVFTVGYPDDDLVYNAGYISAKNGFEDDTMQYRLELPADPGQSGSPVLDAKGNILGIVTAKGNETEGNTYAVSSEALISLLRSLPKDKNVRLPKINRLAGISREAQIAKLEDYTCSVKVYKK